MPLSPWFSGEKVGLRLCGYWEQRLGVVRDVRGVRDVRFEEGHHVPIHFPAWGEGQDRSHGRRYPGPSALRGLKLSVILEVESIRQHALMQNAYDDDAALRLPKKRYVPPYFRAQ